jgi:ribose 5-phosphate isomerase B
MNQVKIAIGSDHAGFDCKTYIIEAFRLSSSLLLQDVGTFSSDSVDYPDFAHKVASKTASGDADYGVLICGSGNGVCITANKHQDIRAALCWNTEIASLARKHNNANIICIPARFVTFEEAELMIKTFLSTPFEGGRHQRRMEKIELSNSNS